MINNFFDFWKEYDTTGKTTEQIALETWDACVNNFPKESVPLGGQAGASLPGIFCGGNMANLRKPNLAVIVDGHELEKLAAELTKVAKNDGQKELENLSRRLEEALADALSLLRKPGDSANNERVLTKYAHNIPAVLKETEEYNRSNER